MAQTKLQKIKSIFDRLVDKEDSLSPERFIREMKVIDSIFSKMSLKDRYKYMLYVEATINTTLPILIDSEVRYACNSNTLARKADYLLVNPSGLRIEFINKSIGLNKQMEKIEETIDNISKVAETITTRIKSMDKRLKGASGEMDVIAKDLGTVAAIKKLENHPNFHPGNDYLH